MLVAIVGATGTGKSALSLDIASSLAERGRAAEIVNADAMQLYRGMDIGTAKLPVSMRRGIPHHMFDVLSVADEASVADYQTKARAAIADVQSRGAVPILVGGSGLYVSSVLYDFRFPGTDPVIRERLEQELVERGPGALHQRLKLLDADAANAIGPSNGRRLVRALEVIEITGEPFGSGLPDESSFSQPTTVIGVSAPRPILVDRLDARVRQMWEDGLLDEVERIGAATMGVTASRAIGYAQAIAQIDGRMPGAEAIEQTAALTRRYARRQVGWFRRYPATTWVDSDDPLRLQVSLDRIGL
ncbi:tRNA dimethylallyltransferase [Glaciihabitans tibetensis]|uniref:tRNA dimethylallyltransferase n=1 Tax=Glaciihabitans tibetensis TaxID=1266600 RepID=A0A2T0VHN2_9MICO|nr:tRNA (adenosine(37)-N6)-dimethylallyltransferase MiaA [Glaciihabitans tibetensis]PRY69722.1 tRNA dimethylallyltransferase [Glaciihabitans tibetensis]